MKWFPGSAVRLRLGFLLVGVAALAALALISSASAGTGAHLVISPTSHNFGSVAAGTTSSTFTFLVKNTGTAQTSGNVTIALSGTGLTQFTILGSGSCAGGTLGAGASCTVDVQFTPDAGASGNKNANLNASASPGGSVHSSLSGTATNAKLAISPSSWNFGSLPAGTTSATKTFTVTNIGTATSGNVAISLSGTLPIQFTILGSGSCAGGTLGAGASCTVDVQFTPDASASGNKNANLNASASPGGSVHSSLSGTATNAALAISPSSWNFGSLPAGTTSATKTFTVANTGTGTSGNVAISLSGGGVTQFTILGSGSCAGGTLGAGASCTVDVQFTPDASASGNKNANLNASASPGGSVHSSLSGTATNAKLAISPSSWNFGSVPAGTTSATQTFTVTNTGTATSGNVAISLSGTLPIQFTILGSGSCAGGTLGAGASCTVDVQFTPDASASGNKKANLNASASPGGSVHSSLSGTATLAKLVISPTHNDFGNVHEGTPSSPFTFTVTNNGTTTSGAISFSVNGTNSGDFAAAGSGGTPCTSGVTTLAPGISCTIDVTFTPSTAAAESASLDLTTPNPAEGTPSATLDGTGILADLDITPTSNDFGTGGSFTFTVTNNGTDTSGAITLPVTGTDAGDFAVSDGSSGTTCDTAGGTTTLAPAASCTFDVTFTPTQPSSTSEGPATVTATAGSGESGDTASLTGTSP